MPQHEHTFSVPARMSRVAVVAPQARLREALVTVADAGVVELAGTLPSPNGETLEALRRVERAAPGRAVTELRLAPGVPDVAELERLGAADLLAGEVELERRAEAAVRHGSFASLVGWTPSAELEPLSVRLAATGAVAVELERPSWIEPPTLIARKPLARAVPPARGDVRRRALRRPRPDALRGRLVRPHVRDDVRRRRARPDASPRSRCCCAARAAAVSPVSSVSGRFRSPPGSPPPSSACSTASSSGRPELVPALWLESGRPAAPAARRRRRGRGAPAGQQLRDRHAQPLARGGRRRRPRRSVGDRRDVCLPRLRRRSRPAGTSSRAVVEIAGGAVVVAGAGAARDRARDRSRHGGARRASRRRSASSTPSSGSAANAISFTRLAAFGLMHAALGAVVWAAASALWGGAVGTVLAVVVLLRRERSSPSRSRRWWRSIQALRLEYYELFSRIFAGRGRPFAPWRIPLASGREET